MKHCGESLVGTPGFCCVGKPGTPRRQPILRFAPADAEEYVCALLASRSAERNLSTPKGI